MTAAKNGVSLLLALLCWLPMAAAAAEVAPRIYGGQDVATGGAPWAAGLVENGNNLFCTGSLITPHWVMTAAHCMVRGTDAGGNVTDTVNTNDLTLFVDQEDISAGLSGQRAVDSYYLHPDYDESLTLLNDIALVLLDQPASGVDTMSVTTVAAFNTLVSTASVTNDELQILGWGEIDPDHPDYTSSSFPFSDQLQQVRLDYRAFNRCQDFWDNFVVESAMICAYEPDPQQTEADDAGDSAPQDAFGEDTCSGDSGGPLLFEYQQAPYLVGLTSFGSDRGCGARDDSNNVIPGVYTRVASYLQWLEDTTRNAGQAAVDITVSGSQSVRSVATAGQANLTLTWRNNSLANSVSNPSLLVTPETPDGQLTAGSGDFACGVPDLSGAIACSYLGTLAPDDSLDMQFSLSWSGAPDSSVAVSAIPQQAQGDYRVANDEGRVSFLFTDKPDLAMVLPSSASGIGKARVDARVDNLSDHQAASGVEVTLTAGGGATIDQVTENDVPVACSGTDTLVCPLGSIAAGASATLSVAVSGGGSGSLSASVSNTEGDVAAANNSDSSTINLSFASFAGGGSSSSSGGFAASLLGLVLLAYRRRKN